jgi:hypothetical protein
MILLCLSERIIVQENVLLRLSGSYPSGKAPLAGMKKGEVVENKLIFAHQFPDSTTSISR